MLNSLRSFVHMLRLPKPDYEVYCREKRLERYEKTGGQVRHLWLHALAHRVLLPLIKAELYLSNKRLTILRDDRLPTDRPVIFCPTHIGDMDIEMSLLAIKTPCWLVFGDPRYLYKDVSGMMLQMNGYIPLDTCEKPDRKAAKAQMKALLQKRGNLLLFPEGTQNLSPNALVGHLYAGAVDLAITCGAQIVPIAIKRDGDRFYFILGKNISYDGCNYEDHFHLTDELRDHMSSLKWELIEHFPAIRRNELPDTAYEDFMKSVITPNIESVMTVDEVRAAVFHPKGITDPAEAFAFLDRLIPCQKNAFLFDKQPTGFSC